MIPKVHNKNIENTCISCTPSWTTVEDDDDDEDDGDKDDWNMDWYWSCDNCLEILANQR